MSSSEEIRQELSSNRRRLQYAREPCLGMLKKKLDPASHHRNAAERGGELLQIDLRGARHWDGFEMRGN